MNENPSIALVLN